MPKRNGEFRICPVCETEFYVKRLRLRQANCCSSVCMGKYKTEKHRLDVELKYGMSFEQVLWYLYHECQMPIRAVAKELDTSTRTVFNWFYEFNIPRRDGPTSVAMQWTDERRKAWGEQNRQRFLANPEMAKRVSLIANLAQQNKNGPNRIEIKMMNALKKARIAFEYQYNVGNKFLCDFCLPQYNVIIECDGNYWHNKERQRKRDASKDAYLSKCGFVVLRFSDTEINTNISECIKTIRRTIKTGQLSMNLKA